MPTAPCPAQEDSLPKAPQLFVVAAFVLLFGGEESKILKLFWLTTIPTPGTIPSSVRAGPAAGLGDSWAVLPSAQLLREAA